MNSLPYLKRLVTELVSRDGAYQPLLTDMGKLVAEGVHSGAINRRVYLDMAGYQIEGLADRESSDLVKEIDDSLAASLVNCVGRDPGAHEAISRLREKLDKFSAARKT